MGRYHCFGCGEDGDVISFVQKLDHTSFHEAVEKLAARIGFELRYEDGGSGPNREDVGRRQRLLDAHKVADEFFRAQLLTPGATEGRNFLHERGFDRAAADQFGVGYAPQGWDSLLKHLRGRGYTDPELKLTGMFSEGGRGIYDRFRGRLIWPIRDIAGDTIGFGARKLYEDDQGPKYLNTPETALYKKSQVLYGIDLAKRNIAKDRQLVVVEGYTDVMACHLAGIPTAVATCGTAFGTEHIKIARRLLSDDGSGGEVIFTFDGDAAGQKAALRAFEEDQRFVAQTYVAVEPSGADPCELRQSKGDAAVRDLIGTRRPLVRIRHPGRPEAAQPGHRRGPDRRPAGIRPGRRPDPRRRHPPGLRPGTGRLAGHAGRGSQPRRGRGRQACRPAAVGRCRFRPVPGAGQRPGPRPGLRVPVRWPAGDPRPGVAPLPPSPVLPSFNRPDPRDPVAAMERQALEVALQQPGDAGRRDLAAVLRGEVLDAGVPGHPRGHPGHRPGAHGRPGALGGTAAAGGSRAAAPARVRARRGAAAGQHRRRRPALLPGHPGAPVRAADHHGSRPKRWDSCSGWTRPPTRRSSSG